MQHVTSLGAFFCYAAMAVSAALVDDTTLMQLSLKTATQQKGGKGESSQDDVQLMISQGIELVNAGSKSAVAKTTPAVIQWVAHDGAACMGQPLDGVTFHYPDGSDAFASRDQDGRHMFSAMMFCGQDPGCGGFTHKPNGNVHDWHGSTGFGVNASDAFVGYQCMEKVTDDAVKDIPDQLVSVSDVDLTSYGLEYGIVDYCSEIGSTKESRMCFVDRTVYLINFEFPKKFQAPETYYLMSDGDLKISATYAEACLNEAREYVDQSKQICADSSALPPASGIDWGSYLDYFEEPCALDDTTLMQLSLKTATQQKGGKGEASQDDVQLMISQGSELVNAGSKSTVAETTPAVIQWVAHDGAACMGQPLDGVTFHNKDGTDAFASRDQDGRHLFSAMMFCGQDPGCGGFTHKPNGNVHDWRGSTGFSVNASDAYLGYQCMEKVTDHAVKDIPDELVSVSDVDLKSYGLEYGIVDYCSEIGSTKESRMCFVDRTVYLINFEFPKKFQAPEAYYLMSDGDLKISATYAEACLNEAREYVDQSKQICADSSALPPASGIDWGSYLDYFEEPCALSDE